MRDFVKILFKTKFNKVFLKKVLTIFKNNVKIRLEQKKPLTIGAC